MKPSLNTSILAYCALSTGFSLLSTTFDFYYVKVFLNFYHIDEGWFHFAQVLFLVWNAVNYPLFAYIQDTKSFALTRTRRESVLYSAPFFALSYLVPWFSWGTGSWLTGVHLVTALCLYDTMFTFVGLAYCCLFTEISTDPAVRLKMTRYSTIASLIGSSSVFFCEFASNSLSSFRAFQCTTIVLACFSCMLMYFTGKYAHTEHERHHLQDSTSSKKDSEAFPEKSTSSYLRLTWDILSNVNFLAFVATNFCQEFHRTFLSSFTVVICDQLIPVSEIPVFVRSIFYGSINIIPDILVIIGTPTVSRFGYFKAIRCNFIWKICGGLLMFVFGKGRSWVLMMFLLLDVGFTGATYTLFNMPLSDVADHDKEKYGRKHPISSMVFGTNALIIKPAISLSPMLVVAILNHYGYSDLKKNLLTPDQISSLHDAMFSLVCFYPIILGVIQMISWSRYRIRNTRLQERDQEIRVTPDKHPFV